MDVDYVIDRLIQELSRLPEWGRSENNTSSSNTAGNNNARSSSSSSSFTGFDATALKALSGNLPDTRSSQSQQQLQSKSSIEVEVRLGRINGGENLERYVSPALLQKGPGNNGRWRFEPSMTEPFFDRLQRAINEQMQVDESNSNSSGTGKLSGGGNSNSSLLTVTGVGNSNSSFTKKFICQQADNYKVRGQGGGGKDGKNKGKGKKDKGGKGNRSVRVVHTTSESPETNTETGEPEESILKKFGQKSSEGKNNNQWGQNSNSIGGKDGGKVVKQQDSGSIRVEFEEKDRIIDLDIYNPNGLDMRISISRERMIEGQEKSSLQYLLQPHIRPEISRKKRRHSYTLKNILNLDMTEVSSYGRDRQHSREIELEAVGSELNRLLSLQSKQNRDFFNQKGGKGYGQQQQYQNPRDSTNSSPADLSPKRRRLDSDENLSPRASANSQQSLRIMLKRVLESAEEISLLQFDNNGDDEHYMNADKLGYDDEGASGVVEGETKEVERGDLLGLIEPIDSEEGGLEVDSSGKPPQPLTHAWFQRKIPKDSGGKHPEGHHSQLPIGEISDYGRLLDENNLSELKP